jgi:hypothetical protein
VVKHRWVGQRPGDIGVLVHEVPVVDDRVEDVEPVKVPRRDGLPLLEGPRHWRRPDDSNRAGQLDYTYACAWLPPALSPQVEELLASGEKIAQEHLGLQALLSEPTLIAGLAS